MGKQTGFLEYERIENKEIPVDIRIRGYEEFHIRSSEAVRRNQGARCMNCGVPFCQSAMQLSGMVVGCPLHNLIPEWNDSIYRGEDAHALARLLKTNRFPEFTGRVCPALCEKACICGQYDDPVTVKDNEFFLIEKGYEKGWMRSNPPSRESGKKAAVIGSGPSGLACADALRRRGHAVTVYEREDRIGGLLMYGIPNMKLDKSVLARRQKLMEEEGVVFRTGVNIGEKMKVSRLKKEYDAVILCCGAKRPRALAAEGLEGAEGVYFAVDFLKAATKNVLGIETLQESMNAKGRNVVVVGGGDTGNDCIGTVIRMGCKSVTALEMMPKPPLTRTPNNPWPEWPKTLRTDYGHQEAIKLFGADPRVFKTTVKKALTKDGRISEITTVEVSFAGGKLTETPGSEKTIPCDLLLIAAGFLGAEKSLPEAFGLAMTQRGVVATPEGSYASSVPGVFAAGDMRRGQSLVVWALAEGRACAAEVDEYLMGYRNS
ncbi:MAG: glutamate synthase subunit beta [Lachnospiraceae bacterium]|nr:glutamate synthase subunit beta [Lachnospiraceae bacterium]